MKYSKCPFSSGCITYLISHCQSCESYQALKERDDLITFLTLERDELSSQVRSLSDELEYYRRLLNE